MILKYYFILYKSSDEFKLFVLALSCFCTAKNINKSFECLISEKHSCTGYSSYDFRMFKDYYFKRLLRIRLLHLFQNFCEKFVRVEFRKRKRKTLSNSFPRNFPGKLTNRLYSLIFNLIIYLQ